MRRLRSPSGALTTLLVVVALRAAGCTSSNITEVAIHVEHGGGERPDRLSVTLLDPNGVRIRDRMVDAAATGARLATVVVTLSDAEDGDRRILVRGKVRERIISEGVRRFAPLPGRRVDVTVTLRALLADADGDGIPDEIDNCAMLPNPEQGPCVPLTNAGSADAGAPPLDAIEAAPGQTDVPDATAASNDLAAESLAPDRSVTTEPDAAGDVAAQTRFDVGPDLPPPGLLAGSVSMAPVTIDLTSNGRVDWVHWGYLGVSNVNRKRGVTAQISTFTAIGNAVLEDVPDSPVAFQWNDGMPVASATAVKAGVIFMGTGNGFEINVVSAPGARTLRLMVTASGAEGRLLATLSDGSAPPYEDRSVLAPTLASVARTFVLRFASAAGQTLRVSWTAYATQQDGGVGLLAATLEAP